MKWICSPVLLLLLVSCASEPVAQKWDESANEVDSLSAAFKQYLKAIQVKDTDACYLLLPGSFCKGCVQTQLAALEAQCRKPVNVYFISVKKKLIPEAVRRYTHFHYDSTQRMNRYLPGLMNLTLLRVQTRKVVFRKSFGPQDSVLVTGYLPESNPD